MRPLALIRNVATALGDWIRAEQRTGIFPGYLVRWIFALPNHTITRFECVWLHFQSWRDHLEQRVDRICRCFARRNRNAANSRAAAGTARGRIGVFSEFDL